MEIGIALWAVFVFFMAKRNNPYSVSFELDTYFYNVVTWLGITLAIYSAIFIGTEFHDGTLRNQIIAGHERSSIYLSHYVVILTVGILQAAVYFLASFLSGSLLLGFSIWKQLDNLPGNFLLIFLALLGYAAIFSCISLLIANKTRLVLIQILLSFFMLFFGFSTVDSLIEPEHIIVFQTPEGTPLDPPQEQPNPRYLSGAKRELYEWVDAALPSSLILHSLIPVHEGMILEDNTILQKEYALPLTIKLPIGTALLSVCFLLSGMYGFCKKDLN